MVKAIGVVWITQYDHVYRPCVQGVNTSFTHANKVREVCWN